MYIGGDRLERGSEVGGYRIDELIGLGGMGIVYRATNVALNRIYALKVLAPELAKDQQFRQRFQREMRIAASLHHPHVVGIHYAGEQDGLLFLAMDYVPGTDLRELLVKDGALGPARAVELLTQVASALDAAHQRGLVHRDIKPANILVTVRDGEEHAYLTDFGLAKRHDTFSGLTLQGSLVGTVDYMAPEQVAGDPIDARTDIYALGCVFFQMLTGKVPYEREQSVATLHAHLHEPPPALEGPLAEAYPELRPVLERAMAKQPVDRYLSAGDLARDAAAALRGTRYVGTETTVATGEARPAGQAAAPTRAHVSSGASARDPELVREESQPAVATVGSPTKLRRESGDGGTAGGDRGDDVGGRGPVRRYWWLAVGLLVAAAAVAAVIVLTSGGSSTPQGQLFEAALLPVPTNHVTGSGRATIRLQGDLATVTVDATGLVNDTHLMHIHAFGQGSCPPASAARLYNGHLAINASDGIPYYGPMVVALTESGETSANEMLAFPRYPSTGKFHYKRTLAVPAAVARAIRRNNAEIVIHGIDYDGAGTYDNVLGRSDLDGGVPQETTDPALCGPLFSVQS